MNSGWPEVALLCTFITLKKVKFHLEAKEIKVVILILHQVKGLPKNYPLTSLRLFDNMLKTTTLS